MKKLFLVVAAVLGIAVAGCETVKQTEVVAVEAEKVRPPMAAACRSDGVQPFKPVEKAKGKDATEATALGHALQSNKSRMTRNTERTLECECAIAKESGNAEDLKRLEGKCPGEGQKPEPPAVAKSAPKAQPKTKTATAS